MTAFNVVRFRVKPGFEEQFVEMHRKMAAPFKGLMGANLVKTGERTYCFVGQWGNFQDIVNARPQMVSLLDGFRAMLEDLGGDLGLTDPISGASVVSIATPKAAKKKAAAKAKPKTAKKAAKAKKPAKAKKKPAKRR